MASQADSDAKEVEKGLNAWKAMICNVITSHILPTREFKKEFEADVRREWEEVKEELEKSLLGIGSQGRLVSTQTTN